MQGPFAPYEISLRSALTSFCLILVVLTWLTSFILMNEQLIIDHYIDHVAYQSIARMIDFHSTWRWMSFILLPALYLLKFFIITCILLMGIFILALKSRFGEIFKIVVIAEFIFFVPLLMKFVWFGFIHRDYTLMELIDFAPLSLHNLLDSSEIPWLAITLKSLNVFELGYWLLLSSGLMHVINISFDQSLGHNKAE